MCLKGIAITKVTLSDVPNKVQRDPIWFHKSVLGERMVHISKTFSDVLNRVNVTFLYFGPNTSSTCFSHGTLFRLFVKLSLGLAMLKTKIKDYTGWVFGNHFGTQISHFAMQYPSSQSPQRF